MTENTGTSLMYLDVLAATVALAPGTKNNRYRGMRNFIGHEMGIAPSSVDLARVDVELVRERLTVVNVIAYLNTLKGRGKKHAELTEARQSLLMLGRLMAEHHYMSPENAHRLRYVKLPTVEAGHRTTTRLDKAQIRQLFTLYPITTELRPVKRARNWLMIVLMLLCGLRAGELLKMRWGDIHEIDGYPVLNVHGKYSKLRVVKLPTQVRHALDAWRTLHPVPEPDKFVFISFSGAASYSSPTYIPLQRHAVINLAVEEAAYITQLPRITPHDLRRTFARNAYLAGASMDLIRQTLGHDSIIMTEHYIKPPLELNRAATDIWADAVTQMLPDGLNADEQSIVVPTPENVQAAGLTRQQAAEYLGISVSKWDRERKKYGVRPWKRITGATKSFEVFRQEDVDVLKVSMSKKGIT